MRSDVPVRDPGMRTARECIAKAEQMERFAAQEREAEKTDEWLAMAVCWRQLSHQAIWQDRYAGHPKVFRTPEVKRA